MYTHLQAGWAKSESYSTTERKEQWDFKRVAGVAWQELSDGKTKKEV